MFLTTRYILIHHGTIHSDFVLNDAMMLKCDMFLKMFKMGSPYAKEIVFDTSEYYVPDDIEILIETRSISIWYDVTEGKHFTDNNDLLELLGCSAPTVVHRIQNTHLTSNMVLIVSNDFKGTLDIPLGTRCVNAVYCSGLVGITGWAPSIVLSSCGIQGTFHIPPLTECMLIHGNSITGITGIGSLMTLDVSNTMIRTLNLERVDYLRASHCIALETVRGIITNHIDITYSPVVGVVNFDGIMTVTIDCNGVRVPINNGTHKLLYALGNSKYCGVHDVYTLKRDHTTGSISVNMRNNNIEP